jgi:hypothetical protein
MPKMKRADAATVTPNLYEIPITLVSFPSRKHMRQVAPHRRPSERTAIAFWIHIKAVSRKKGVCCDWRTMHCKEHPMLDVIMLAIGLGFFALSVGYTIACDRL